MKEALFRGKSKTTGEWVFGSLVTLKEKGIVKFYFIRNNTDITKNTLVKEIVCEVIPETVGQYTGIKDIFNKEIYKDDIVQEYLNAKKRKIYVVEEDPIDPAMFLQDINNEYVPEYDFVAVGTRKLQIIGNIHDNPELLQKWK